MKPKVPLSIFAFFLALTAICSCSADTITKKPSYDESEISKKILNYTSDNSPSMFQELAHNAGITQYTGPAQSSVRKVGAKILTSLTEYETVADSLEMQIYSPPDEGFARSAILVFYGGGFISGEVDSPSIKMMAYELATRGHIVISVDYRSGRTLQLSGAMHLAAQDARSALHYVYKNARFLNVNPERISLSGFSSGAITAAHCAFLDSTEVIEDKGSDIENQFGALSQSFDPKPPIWAVINICGAVYSTDIIDNKDNVEMLISFHGVKDDVVRPECSIPIPKHMNKVKNFFQYFDSALRGSELYSNISSRYEVMKLCGSKEMHAKARKEGIYSHYTEFKDADHNLMMANGKIKSTGKKIITQIAKILHDHEYNQ